MHLVLFSRRSVGLKKKTSRTTSKTIITYTNKIIHYWLVSQLIVYKCVLFLFSVCVIIVCVQVLSIFLIWLVSQTLQYLPTFCTFIYYYFFFLIIIAPFIKREYYKRRCVNTNATKKKKKTQALNIFTCQLVYLDF